MLTVENCIVMYIVGCLLFFFFFNDTATTEIYTLSLHDALPISWEAWDLLGMGWDGLGTGMGEMWDRDGRECGIGIGLGRVEDRKSTRLNSSHANISYAVFCLKKKKQNNSTSHTRIHNMTLV